MGSQKVIPDEWFSRIPKVELHLHLEGAIPHQALWQLVKKYGGHESVPTMGALVDKFRYRDFPSFLATWHWKNQFLRSYEDFSFIAEEVARDLASQNIRYVEAFYSPGDFADAGLAAQPLTEAIRAGLDRVTGVEVALVADLIRDVGPERADRTLSQVNEVRSSGVIGIGIGGSEHQCPPEPFESVYRRARELGFRTSAHAGEAAGAESVWGAIRALQVDRIGHGTRAIEDPALIDYLAEHQIPVELCPISNLRTGVVESIQSHPVRRFFDRGVLISINTDDPKMFGNSLVQEFRILNRELGFSKSEIVDLMQQAISGSWLPEDRKKDRAWFEA